MRRLLSSIAAIVAAWAERAGAQTPDPSWRKVKLATTPSLRIPPAVELRQDQIRYPDFRIYRVFIRDTELLGVFRGNAAMQPRPSQLVPAPAQCLDRGR